MTTGAVGNSTHRFGGYGRVTGQQKYLADIHLEDALHVKLVILPVAHARINSIDSSAAEAVPGVRFVMTAADIPDPMPRFGPQYQDRPVIAIDEVKYHGEPVVAVAADTKDAAEAAARLVEVDYTELTALVGVEDSLAPDAELVQDPSVRAPGPFVETNILREYDFGWGDVDAAEADVVLEREYKWPAQTHFAIEPHACMAAPEDDGIVVWSTIQHPYQLQKTIAKVLDMPLAKVRVIAPDPGGGFGGKQHPKIEPLVAFLSLLTGRPCRLILTLDESFTIVRRASAEIRVRMGFTNDGKLVFQEYENNFVAGAYGDTGDRIAAKASFLSAGPYITPDVRIKSRVILTHTTPTHPYRGFGVPHVGFAREGTLNEAAEVLGIDPLELRLRNLARKGEEHVPGDTPADGDWEQTVRKAAEEIGWDTPVPEGRGRGLAVGVKSGPTTGLSYSIVRLLVDGSVLVFTGTSDMGQGARTIFAQIAADEMGVPIEQVQVVMGDTAIVPYDQQTSASRSSVLMGNAVLFACRDIQEQIRQRAAKLFEIEPDDIVVDKGIVELPDSKYPLPEVARDCLGRLGGEIIGTGEMRKEAYPEHPLGGTAAFFEFNCTAVELEVDEGTGEILIHRHVTVGDVGLALNPAQVKGQDDGAAVMGLSHALMEHIIRDPKGRHRNVGAIDYRIPTSLDLPIALESHMIENADGPGPYGVKGISEGSCLVVPPAVAAAVHDAIGVRIRDLPMSPERVWRAMKEQE